MSRIVADDGGFLGLITRIDLLNHLRQKPDMTRPQRSRTTRLRHPRHPRRPVARPDDRRGHDADLRHLDLRAAEPRRAQGLDYGRSHNPTRFAYERCVADLESGAQAFAFASGLAAIATVLELLDAGAHVVALRRPLRRHAAACSSACGGAARGCASPSSTSPTATICSPRVRPGHEDDLGRDADATRCSSWSTCARSPRCARARGIIAVADNTFASPGCSGRSSSASTSSSTRRPSISTATPT